jgi:hypothetical protein
MSFIKIGFISLPLILCSEEYTGSTLSTGGLKKDIVWSSGTMVYKYQTTWYHNPEAYIMTCMFTCLVLMAEIYWYQEGDSFLALSRFFMCNIITEGSWTPFVVPSVFQYPDPQQYDNFLNCFKYLICNFLKYHACCT